MPGPSSYDRFDEWVSAIKHSCAASSNWGVIDEWAYSTLGPPSHATNKHPQKLYHLCHGSHRKYLEEPNAKVDNQITFIEDELCVSCGTNVPEGIKMIVMLLESNI